MSKQLKFDEATLADALPRILERVVNPKDLDEWYEQVGIDREFLYTMAFGMMMEDETDSISAESIVLGVVIAWEAVRGQLK